MTELYTAKDGRLLSSIFVEGPAGTQTVGYRDSDGTDLGDKYIAGSCGVETGFTYNGTDLGDLFIDESGLAPSVESAGSSPAEGTMVSGSESGHLGSWWIGTYYPASGDPRMSSQYVDNSGGGLITVSANATGGSGSYTYTWTAHAEGTGEPPSTRRSGDTGRTVTWDEDYNLTTLFDQGWISMTRKEGTTPGWAGDSASHDDMWNANQTDSKYISNHASHYVYNYGYVQDEAPYVVNISGGTCSIYPQRILPVYYDSDLYDTGSGGGAGADTPRHTIHGTFEITCTVTDTVSRRTATKTWTFDAGPFFEFSVISSSSSDSSTDGPGEGY